MIIGIRQYRSGMFRVAVHNASSEPHPIPAGSTQQPQLTPHAYLNNMP